MQPRAPILLRILLSLVVGLVVFPLSLIVAWPTYQTSAVRGLQDRTVTDILKVGRALDAYQQEKHTLPRTLTGLIPVKEDTFFQTNESGAPIDAWGRPLHYWTDGAHYRVTSYGRDGKPGGLGLDYDLTSDETKVAAAKTGFGTSRLKLKQAAPTFRQFVSDPLARSMLDTCVFAGVVAFVLGFVVIGSPILTRRPFAEIVARLAVIVGGAIFIATLMAAFHVPSGH